MGVANKLRAKKILGRRDVLHVSDAVRGSVAGCQCPCPTQQLN